MHTTLLHKVRNVHQRGNKGRDCKTLSRGGGGGRPQRNKGRKWAPGSEQECRNQGGRPRRDVALLPDSYAGSLAGGSRRAERHGLARCAVKGQKKTVHRMPGTLSANFRTRFWDGVASSYLWLSWLAWVPRVIMCGLDDDSGECKPGTHGHGSRLGCAFLSRCQQEIKSRPLSSGHCGEAAKATPS